MTTGPDPKGFFKSPTWMLKFQGPDCIDLFGGKGLQDLTCMGGPTIHDEDPSLSPYFLPGDKPKDDIRPDNRRKEDVLPVNEAQAKKRDPGHNL